MKQSLSLMVLVGMLGMSQVAHAQSSPTGVTGCMDANGGLYNLVPLGDLGEQCAAGDVPVQFGPGVVSNIGVGEGLVGGGSGSSVGIAIDPNLSIPPACPPGQVPVSDDHGGWVCTPPGLLSNPNKPAKVWVVTKFDFYGSGRNAVYFINPSDREAQVRCIVFSQDGLNTSVQDGIIVPPGGQRSCFPVTRFTPFREWALLVSSTPILPIAEERPNGRRRPGIVTTHSVDCDYPEGYEFVCKFAFD